MTLFKPSCRGKLKAVIFDWAGTTVDFGCHAPVAVLQEVFAAAGVPITPAAARQSMGLAKKDHVRSILLAHQVAQAWEDRNGAVPGEEEVELLYGRFVPLQTAQVAEYSDVIPGVPEVLQTLRSRGLKIGSTTGYTRAMLDLLRVKAATQGYVPDTSVTPEEAHGGRPEPWMCFANMERLGVYPPGACVKVGDTPADIAEALNAGMWAIGVTDSGNEVGLTLAEWQALSIAEQDTRRQTARERLERAGAHWVVQSLDQLPLVLDHIEEAMGRV